MDSVCLCLDKDSRQISLGKHCCCHSKVNSPERSEYNEWCPGKYQVENGSCTCCDAMFNLCVIWEFSSEKASLESFFLPLFYELPHSPLPHSAFASRGTGSMYRRECSGEYGWGRRAQRVCFIKHIKTITSNWPSKNGPVIGSKAL